MFTGASDPGRQLPALPGLENCDSAATGYAKGKQRAAANFFASPIIQFANPKAWIMGLALTAGFLPEEGNIVVNALALAGFAEIIAMPCISLWAGFGIAIGRLLKTPKAWRYFNGAMGGLTASCVVFILT